LRRQREHYFLAERYEGDKIQDIVMELEQRASVAHTNHGGSPRTGAQQAIKPR
jgi:hypothetical protein